MLLFSMCMVKIIRYTKLQYTMLCTGLYHVEPFRKIITQCTHAHNSVIQTLKNKASIFDNLDYKIVAFGFKVNV